MTMRVERHDLHGEGSRDHQVYEMPSDGAVAWWEPVTDVPCPVAGCDQTVAWYEAGYVPGYRICMRFAGNNAYDLGTRRHRFLAGGGLDASSSTLIRDDCCEHDEA